MSSQAQSRSSRGVIGAYVIALLALVMAMSTGAYAAVRLGTGVVHTRNIATGAVTRPKLANGAVNAGKVSDHSLRLRDLGGVVGGGKSVTSSDLSIPANQCRLVYLRLENPAPHGLVGSLVVTSLTTALGGPVLDNAGVLLPTVVSATSQGGALLNTMVCAGGSTQTVPAGSVFHYRVLGP
ncbi:MAG: hypothetical protein WAV00_02305 [Nocardioides sp.]